MLHTLLSPIASIWRRNLIHTNICTVHHNVRIFRLLSFVPPPRLPSSVCWFLIGYMHKNCKHSWINKADRDLLVSYHIKAFSVAPLYSILLSCLFKFWFSQTFRSIYFLRCRELPSPVYVLSFHCDLCFLLCIYVLNINSELLILALF